MICRAYNGAVMQRQAGIPATRPGWATSRPDTARARRCQGLRKVLDGFSGFAYADFIDMNRD
jgi:hypothetical protein